ncbi:hypothetical protein RBWH47_01645 [Rhodopirellula baltica WH47]|uniref:Uncharacterized protein n=1 Tax=Rhodopirellula baltica WH47 TaxID=991778 RepID=F2AM01_RHOBT|nr:hypothetical protein RBWH47_01645 [Rhodopirellula baltica WH47]
MQQVLLNLSMSIVDVTMGSLHGSACQHVNVVVAMSRKRAMGG